jgi:hypothetical protein
LVRGPYERDYYLERKKTRVKKGNLVHPVLIGLRTTEVVVVVVVVVIVVVADVVVAVIVITATAVVVIDRVNDVANAIIVVADIVAAAASGSVVVRRRLDLSEIFVRPWVIAPSDSLRNSITSVQLT